MEEYLPIFELIYEFFAGNDELFTGGFIGYYLNKQVNLAGILKKGK